MVFKRLKKLAIAILICILLLMARLMHIQLIEPKNFSKKNINLLEASVRQRTLTMILDNGRGKFYDRNGIPLNMETIPSLVLFPFLKHMDWEAGAVAEILGVDKKALTDAVLHAEEPVVFGNPDPYILTEWQMEAINALKIPGVFAVEKQSERVIPLAAQLIGITGENERLLKDRYPERKLPYYTPIGITGLEKSFDPFLIQEEPTKLVYHVDGMGGPLFGIDVKYVNPANPFYPVRVNTTLDFEIQKEAERIANVHKIKKGGMILLDLETSSILALVSRPQMDKIDPFKDDGASNFMIKAHYPGSVFKTVIATAAIDHNLESAGRKFDCSKNIRGEPDPESRHGMLDFTDSFAVSCNYTFATLAKELLEIDPGIIEEYAEKYNLLSATTWQGNVFHLKHFKQLSNEEKGQVFLTEQERTDQQIAALSGIGQHNVKVTPVGVANMMATIARGGKRRVIQAVSSIEYKNGTEFFTFENKDENEVISPYTAMRMQQLLREVVKNKAGTGRNLAGLPYEVAGKSGTAQTGVNKEGTKQELENKWFAGYFPFENPKYVLVVVQLDVSAGTGSPVPVFQDMVKYLYQYDQRQSAS